MARRCGLVGKEVQVGNMVSHSNHKTKKRFLPNMQNVSVMSDILKCKFRMRISTAAIRTIEVNGGIDSYLMSLPDNRFTGKILAIKKRIKKALTPNN